MHMTVVIIDSTKGLEPVRISSKLGTVFDVLCNIFDGPAELAGEYQSHLAEHLLSGKADILLLVFILWS
jgi:hypothetical protein